MTGFTASLYATSFREGKTLAFCDAKIHQKALCSSIGEAYGFSSIDHYEVYIIVASKWSS
jgi:hypothetical protein